MVVVNPDTGTLQEVTDVLPKSESCPHCGLRFAGFLALKVPFNP